MGSLRRRERKQLTQFSDRGWLKAPTGLRFWVTVGLGVGVSQLVFIGIFDDWGAALFQAVASALLIPLGATALHFFFRPKRRT